jgi:hypothetical protein
LMTTCCWILEKVARLKKLSFLASETPRVTGFFYNSFHGLVH